MNMNRITTIATALAVVCLLGTSAFALDIGGDIKVMGYYAEDVEDFGVDGSDDDDNFFRTEAHLWFEADLTDEVMTRISIETDRDWHTVEGEGSNNGLDTFIEEAYIQMGYLYDSAFSAKLGRQFITLGDGFIIGDGNPVSEASLNTKGEYETDPFDAILVWYDAEDWVLKLLYAQAFESRVMQDDTRFYTAYWTFTGIEEHVIDLYFVYADIESSAVLAVYDPALVSADVYAAGGRLAGSFYENFTYKLEALYEFGEVDYGGTDGDISAWAAEAGLKYAFDAEYNPWLGFTYVYESGDDDLGDTDTESFISLFEDRTYGEIFDPWTSSNVHVFNLSGGFDLNEDLALYAKYYYIMAAEDEVYGDEDDIGHELDVYLDYMFSEETSAMLAGGFAAPGDAVENVYGSDDTAWFFRAGVKVEF